MGQSCEKPLYDDDDGPYEDSFIDDDEDDERVEDGYGNGIFGRFLGMARGVGRWGGTSDDEDPDPDVEGQFYSDEGGSSAGGSQRGIVHSPPMTTTTVVSSDIEEQEIRSRARMPIIVSDSEDDIDSDSSIDEQRQG